jgi:hypothetical protein
VEQELGRAHTFCQKSFSRPNFDLRPALQSRNNKSNNVIYGLLSVLFVSGTFHSHPAPSVLCFYRTVAWTTLCGITVTLALVLARAFQREIRNQNHHRRRRLCRRRLCRHPQSRKTTARNRCGSKTPARWPTC